MGYLVYDAAIVAVLVLFVCLGWRRGLLLSLCGLVVAVAAFLGAGFLADTLDEPVANALQPALSATIQAGMSEQLEAQPEAEGTDPMDALREMGGLYAWAADALEEVQLTIDHVTTDTVQEVAQAAAHAIAVQLAHSLVFALAFLVLYILLTLLLHALDLVAKLPGLRFCNGLGGGVIGLAKGVLVVFVAVAVLMSTPYQPDGQILEKTHVLRFFVEKDPILTLFAG